MSSGGATRLEVVLKVHGPNGRYLVVNLTSITVHVYVGGGRGGSTPPSVSHSTPAELCIGRAVELDQSPAGKHRAMPASTDACQQHTLDYRCGHYVQLNLPIKDTLNQTSLMRTLYCPDHIKLCRSLPLN